MKKRKTLYPLALLALGLALLLPAAARPAPEDGTEQQVQVFQKEAPADGPLYDNPLLYEGTDPLSVITMYLTVTPGNEADGSAHTWEEVDTTTGHYYEQMGIERYKTEGLLQIDETGEGITPGSFGYGERAPNVSIQIRGQTSTSGPQKNFKIRIKKGRGMFRDQRTLDLNKHYSEPYRFANKLAYDLAAQVPQVIAGRTQFVHLYVKDLSAGDQADFRDYGLYTMVEQVNRRYLKNHGLDENAQLYKVTFFEWNEYDAVMIPSDDPDFDQAAFEEYLEIKGDRDTAKLRAVVEKLQNYSIPIDDIIEAHFDAENLCYFMAFNILIHNYDNGARNLFLYSPLNSQRFYLLCWDMDASFRGTYNQAHGQIAGFSWEQGFSQFLGLTLVNRMMREEKYREMLTAAIEDLHGGALQADHVMEMVEGYRSVVKPYLYQGTDAAYARVTEAEYDELTTSLDTELQATYEGYYQTYLAPWPFFVDYPELDKEKGQVLLHWEASWEPRGEEVTYQYILAHDHLFQDVIDQGEGLHSPSVVTGWLEPGVYYLRVRAKNESGYEMDCFDYCFAKGISKSYACYCFRIKPDGTIETYTGVQYE